MHAPSQIINVNICYLYHMCKLIYIYKSKNYNLLQTMNYSGNYQNQAYQPPQNQYQNNGYQPQQNIPQSQGQTVTYSSNQSYSGQPNYSAVNQSGSRMGAQVPPNTYQNPNTAWNNPPYQTPQPINTNYAYTNNNQGFGQQPFQPVVQSGQSQQNYGSQNPYNANSFGGNQQNSFQNQGERSSWNSHSGWGSRYGDLVDGQNTFWKQNYQIKNKSSTVFKLNPNKYYSISTALDPSMVLDVSKTSLTKKVVIYTNNKQPNQQFRIQEQGGMYTIFCCQQQGAVLKVQKQSCANEANIVAGTQKYSQNQQFQILPVSEKEEDGYFIKTFNGRCLDVDKQKTSNGTQVIQYDYNGGKNQIWLIQQA